MPGESKTSVRRIEAVERETRALALRKGGATFEGIKESLGYADRSGAYRAVMAALNRIPAAEAEDVRRINGERLNDYLLYLQGAVRRGDVVAIRASITIVQELNKVFNVYAPQKVEVTGLDGGALEVDARVLLGQMMDRMEGNLAATEGLPESPSGYSEFVPVEPDSTGS